MTIINALKTKELVIKNGKRSLSWHKDYNKWHVWESNKYKRHITLLISTKSQKKAVDCLLNEMDK